MLPGLLVPGGGRVIDIVELLEDYVRLLEARDIERTSTESKIMTEAAEEIKRLRNDLEFQIKFVNDNNNSRLRLQDVILKGMDLYEETCKNMRETHVDGSVCGMCVEDCYSGFDGEAFECSGFEKDDCFRLNVNKYNDIIFREEEETE